VSEDLNKPYKLTGDPHPDSMWPDKSGFEHDINVPTGQTREDLYGIKYIPKLSPSGVQPWTNWSRKVEPDGRFCAVTDANAWTYPFPESEAPWKFARYVYKGFAPMAGPSGILTRTIVVEPPLYEPANLSLINNPSGRVLQGRAQGNLRCLHWYNSYSTLKDYKEEDLDKGLETTKQDPVTGLVTKTTLLPWTDENNGQRFRKGKAYDVVTDFNYTTPNHGVALYRTEIPVKSVKFGAHANIPSGVLSMQAPVEWVSPSNLFTSRAVPRLKASIGNPLFLPSGWRGVISYNDMGGGDGGLASGGVGNTGLSGASIRDAKIDPNTTLPSGIITYFTQPSPSGIPYIVDPAGSTRLIGRPQSMKDNVLKLRMFSQNHTSLDYVHSGCSFWKGSAGRLYCQALEDGGVVTPGYCETENASIWIDDTVTPPVEKVGDPGLFSAFADASGIIPRCPMFSPESPRVVAAYEALAQTPEEIAAMNSILDGNGGHPGGGAGIAASQKFERGGGAKNLRNGNAMFEAYFNNPPLMAMGGGAALGAGMATGALDVLRTPVNTPREMGNYDLRMEIEWEYVIEPVGGREYKSNFHIMEGSYDNTTLGTGVTSFDLASTTYRGVNNQFMDDINLMSEHRFLSNILPCYRADKCNFAYGQVNMRAEPLPGVFSDVATALDGSVVDKQWCRYYNWSCPKWNTERRAYEYALNFNHLVEKILKPFRSRGIEAFPLLGQEMIKEMDSNGKNGVYAAVGPAGVMPGVTEDSGKYFFYTIPYPSGNHKDSDVFAYITHYDDSGEICVKNGKPWLVKLYDSYRMPTGFHNVINNPMKFIGGRAPEYSDMSEAYSNEIMCPLNAGGEIEPDASNKLGGDPRGIEDAGGDFLVGYFVGIAGKLITDGRSVGPEYSVDEGRIGSIGRPNAIAAGFGNTIISPGIDARARQKNCWIYGSDTPAKIALLTATPPTADYGEGNVVDCPPPTVPFKLPRERKQIRCATCGFTIIEGDPDWKDDLPAKEKLCPICGLDDLVKSDEWTHFAPCQAMGRVEVWAPPGQIIRMDGYYFSSPTLISSDIFSEIDSKLGPPTPKGPGHGLGRTTSANAFTEADVARPPRPSGMFMAQGLPMSREWIDPSGQLLIVPAASGTIQDNSHDQNNPGFPDISPKTVPSGQQKEWDPGRYANLTVFKNVRNKIEPMLAYPVGRSADGGDFYGGKQPAHMDRHGDKIGRAWSLKRQGLAPQIMAASDTGGTFMDEFWDGKLPGKSIVVYYPVSPEWWRIHNVIGFISKTCNDPNPDHMDNTGTPKKLVSSAIFWCAGWLPLDREVVKAYAIATPAYFEPSCEAIGITWSGRNITRHYHPFDVGGGRHAPERSMARSTGPSSDGFDLFNPWLDRPMAYGSAQPIKEVVDPWFGFKSGDDPFITWGGHGTSIVQQATEDAVWKNLTFDQFRSIVRSETMEITFQCGDRGVQGSASYDFTMMSRNMLNNFLLNATQPIPSYFDLSGKNQEQRLPRSGPSIAAKTVDTEWATDGQVLENPDINRARAAGSGSAGAEGGGNGINSSGRITRSMDITDQIKKIYANRQKSVFKLKCGMSMDELIATREAERLATAGIDASNDVPVTGQSIVNGEVYDAKCDVGFLLNYRENYPVMSMGKTPVRIELEKIALSSDSKGRIVQCTDWYKGFEVK
jgi:hypothetical protein